MQMHAQACSRRSKYTTVSSEIKQLMYFSLMLETVSAYQSGALRGHFPLKLL